MSFFYKSSERCLNRFFFHNMLGNEKRIEFNLDPTPKGPCGGSGRLLVHFIPIKALLGHINTATAKKVDFKSTLSTSVGASNNG